MEAAYSSWASISGKIRICRGSSVENTETAHVTYEASSIGSRDEPVLLQFGIWNTIFLGLFVAFSCAK